MVHVRNGESLGHGACEALVSAADIQKSHLVENAEEARTVDAILISDAEGVGCGINTLVEVQELIGKIIIASKTCLGKDDLVACLLSQRPSSLGRGMVVLEVQSKARTEPAILGTSKKVVDNLPSEITDGRDQFPVDRDGSVGVSRKTVDVLDGNLVKRVGSNARRVSNEV